MASLMRIILRQSHRRKVQLFVGISLVMAAGAATAALAERSARGTHVASPSQLASRFVSRIHAPEVSSIRAHGTSVIVRGTSNGTGADATRALWYEAVAGAAYAEKTGATSLKRVVASSGGRVLRAERDRVSSERGPAATLSGSVINRGSRERARNLHLELLQMHHLSFFGGATEFVIQPSDPATFLATAGANIASFLGPLADNEHAYLVTVVDSTRAPLLILGFTPGVGGGIGEGTAWQAPNVNSDAIWGRTRVNARQ